MKLNDFFSDKFMNQFPKNSIQRLKNLEVSFDTPSTPLEEICSIVNISLNYNSLPEHTSGQYDENRHSIIVNKDDPSTRQRFTIAHELGHAILGHHGVSLRSTNLAEYNSILEKSQEMNANHFAADLLMPRKLMVKLTKQIIEEYHLDPQGLGTDDIQLIIDQLARKMLVSKKAMTYRVQNVRLFEKNG